MRAFFFFFSLTVCKRRETTIEIKERRRQPVGGALVSKTAVWWFTLSQFSSTESEATRACVQLVSQLFVLIPFVRLPFLCVCLCVCLCFLKLVCGSLHFPFFFKTEL